MPERDDEKFEGDDLEKENPSIRKTILRVVGNQLKNNDPPAVRETLARLRGEGISEENAKIYIAQALMGYYDNERPFNIERYIRNLKNLPSEPRE